MFSDTEMSFSGLNT